MLTLAVERSTCRPGWALFRDSDCILEVVADEEPARTPDWLARLTRAIQKIGFSVADIDRFAVGLGPGSFSGTRSAVAAMQGFSLPGNRPLLGVSSAAAQAFTLLTERETNGIYSPVAVVGDARRERLWCAVFILDPACNANAPRRLLSLSGDAQHPLTHDAPDFVLTPWNDLPAHLPSDTHVVSPDWDRLGAMLSACLSPEQVSVQPRRPTASEVGRLVLADSASACADPTPIYLHPAVALPKT